MPGNETSLIEMGARLGGSSRRCSIGDTQVTEIHLIEIERVRSEAARHLAEHEIACERRYGELQAQLTKIEALHNRNTRLLYVVLGGMLAVATRAFWPALFGG